MKIEKHEENERKEGEEAAEQYLMTKQAKKMLRDFELFSSRGFWGMWAYGLACGSIINRNIMGHPLLGPTIDALLFSTFLLLGSLSIINKRRESMKIMRIE